MMSVFVTIQRFNNEKNRHYIACDNSVRYSSVFTTKSMSAPSLTPIQLANIEALTNTEGGYSIPCYSSASRDYNKAYVDFPLVHE